MVLAGLWGEANLADYLKVRMVKCRINSNKVIQNEKILPGAGFEG